MRLFTARGIPCVMAGPSGIERAHAVDEWVDAGELTALARVLVRLGSSAVQEGDSLGRGSCRP